MVRGELGVASLRCRGPKATALLGMAKRVQVIGGAVELDATKRRHGEAEER